MIRNTSKNNGCVIWFTGISGSGKTTLGTLLKKRLEQKKFKVEMLDGDVVRNYFENDLGYTRKERIQNVRRIAFAAKMLADHGVIVIVANIAPYYEVRDFIRRKIPNYFQIYLKASLEKVAERDVKGHYGNFTKGKIKSLVGLDDEYDIPRNPALTIDTDHQSVETSIAKILAHLKHFSEKGVS